MGMVKVLAVFFALLAAAYIWLIPFLAERLAKKVPISYEERLGDGIYNELKPSFVIDAEKTAHINDFFRELNINSKYNIRITVVNENIANAFAMPGGNIIVYDKLIADMNSYEELAALLSHEFTHVNEKHTTRSLFRKLASSLFLSILLGDVGSVGNVIINNADDLKGLSYSRKLEKEADRNGLKLHRRPGAPPRRAKYSPGRACRPEMAGACDRTTGTHQGLAPRRSRRAVKSCGGRPTAAATPQWRGSRDRLRAHLDLNRT